MADGVVEGAPSREQLIHSLYEAAELEHNLMCTYLYAAFSLKSADEGLSEIEADAVGRWRRQIIQVAIEEMGHLAAVWNITAALGGRGLVARNVDTNVARPAVYTVGFGPKGGYSTVPYPRRRRRFF